MAKRRISYVPLESMDADMRRDARSLEKSKASPDYWAKSSQNRTRKAA